MKVEYEDAALCISRTFQGRYGQLYLNLDTTPVLGFISGILWLAELFRGSDSSTSTSPVRLPDPKFSMERRGRRNVIQPHNPLDLYVASYLLLMMSLGCKLCQFQRYTGFPLTRVYVTIRAKLVVLPSCTEGSEPSATCLSHLRRPSCCL
jgi:hypothetical protein